MLNLTKEQIEQQQLANEYFDESLLRLFEGNLRDAKIMATRCSDIAEEIGDARLWAATTNLLSVIYDEMGDESLNLSLLFKALNIALDYDIYEVSAKAYNNLGSKFMNAKDYERSLVYFVKASEMFDIACEKNVISEEVNVGLALVMSINLSFSNCMLGNTEKAREYYELAKKRSQHPLNKEFLFLFSAFEGLLLWKLGNKEESISKLPEIMKMAETTDYATDYVEVITYIIMLVKEMKNYDAWKEVLQIM